MPIPGRMSISMATFVASMALSACAIISPPPPQADGQAIYSHLAEKSYQGWALWPDSQPLHQGAFPHGELVTTFVNRTAEKAFRKGQWPLPGGSMVVADNYLASQKLASTTVMYKQPDGNSQAGGWYWVQYLPGGRIRLEGEPVDCVNCHSSRKKNDFLFAEPPK